MGESPYPHAPMCDVGHALSASLTLALHARPDDLRESSASHAKDGPRAISPSKLTRDIQTGKAARPLPRVGFEATSRTTDCSYLQSAIGLEVWKTMQNRPDRS